MHSKSRYTLALLSIHYVWVGYEKLGGQEGWHGVREGMTERRSVDER